MNNKMDKIPAMSLISSDLSGHINRTLGTYLGRFRPLPWNLRVLDPERNDLRFWRFRFKVIGVKVIRVKVSERVEDIIITFI